MQISLVSGQGQPGGVGEGDHHRIGGCWDGSTQSSKSGSGRDMVYTGHMQKSRVRTFHTIAYGGQTVSAVSGSVVENRAYGGHCPLASNSTR